MKNKAMQLVRSLSNSDLESTLKRFGQNVSVNFLTRGMVESGIENKLNDYTDEEIENFINKYFN